MINMKKLKVRIQFASHRDARSMVDEFSSATQDKYFGIPTHLLCLRLWLTCLPIQFPK